MKHLTMVDVYAGSYYCGRYFSQMGASVRGERAAEDTAAHAVYAPQSYIQASDMCPDCLAVWEGRAPFEHRT